MNDILHELLAPALVHAIEENQRSLFQHFRCWPRAEVYSTAELTWTLTSVPFALFNSVLGARLPPESADEVIEAVIARGISRQVPLMWWTGPSTQPADLAARLEAHGFVLADQAPGMAADLQALPEPPRLGDGLSIERVCDVDTLRGWAEVLWTGFEMPSLVGDAMAEWTVSSGFDERGPLLNYLCRWHGEPVATASVFLGGGVAGIYNVCTLPHARRMGIGAAITLKALLDARALGYRVGILHSSLIGLNVYQQMGFREYCTIGQYVWEPRPLLAGAQ